MDRTYNLHWALKSAMTKILIAPNHGTAEHAKLPTLFLAGPIKGARRWQDEVIANIPIDLPVAIASPRRDGDMNDDFSESDYLDQVKWESAFLRRASQTGCILFWLAAESEHECSRSYAQTTRFELGEWNALAPDRIVVGIEDGFSGGRYIRFRRGSRRPTYTTLADTLAAALKVIFPT